MSGIERITEKITADAENYAAEVRRNADAHAERLLTEAAERAESAYESIMSRSEKERQAIITRAVSSADILKRNILLDAKLALADKAFGNAAKALTDIEPEKYEEFLFGKLAEAISAIGTGEISGDGYTVTLNSEDIEKYGKKLEEKAENGGIAKGGRLVLSDRCAEISGGFILSYANTEINASFEALLGGIRKGLTAEVCRTLFEITEGDGKP